MWYVYILECSDNTYYTGSTNNINARLELHNLQKGANYTRGRTPVRLVHRESFRTKAKAFKHEALIKKFTRKQKEKLVRGT